MRSAGGAERIPRRGGADPGAEPSVGTDDRADRRGDVREKWQAARVFAAHRLGAQPRRSWAWFEQVHPQPGGARFCGPGQRKVLEGGFGRAIGTPIGARVARQAVGQDGRATAAREYALRRIFLTMAIFCSSDNSDANHLRPRQE